MAVIKRVRNGLRRENGTKAQIEKLPLRLRTTVSVTGAQESRMGYIFAVRL